MAVRRPIPAPLTFGSLAEICVACCYSNHQARNLGGRREGEAALKINIFAHPWKIVMDIV